MTTAMSIEAAGASVAEALTRKQFELFTAQMKDLSSLTQKVVAETTEPIRHNMAEPFKIAS